MRHGGAEAVVAQGAESGGHGDHDSGAHHRPRGDRRSADEDGTGTVSSSVRLAAAIVICALPTGTSGVGRAT
jgi:NAD(P)H-dependent flavin oxidoreductase YrpB (nitropropane dioxygenase family)